jgi:uncharacterized protein (TIGR04255 family)
MYFCRERYSYIVQYSNNHLVEVNCGFQFPEETVVWDSTFFGQYYEKIKSLGFDEKQERKGVQITFNGNSPNINKSPFETTAIEDQVVFKNNTKGIAILFGKGQISFHYLKEYPGWDLFVKEVITPYFQFYKELGLGNGKRQCSIVYLNSFKKEKNHKLSDYFTIISPLEHKFGLEIVTSVQRIISSSNKKLLVAKLNSQIVGDIQNINFECGGICVDESSMCDTENWLNQAKETHNPIKSFFEEIITEKLRQEL